MNNNTESDNLSNNAIFNSWNKGLKEGTLDVHGQTHKPKNVYKKIVIAKCQLQINIVETLIKTIIVDLSRLHPKFFVFFA